MLSTLGLFIPTYWLMTKMFLYITFHLWHIYPTCIRKSIYNLATTCQAPLTVHRTFAALTTVLNYLQLPVSIKFHYSRSQNREPRHERLYIPDCFIQWHSFIYFFYGEKSVAHFSVQTCKSVLRSGNTCLWDSRARSIQSGIQGAQG